ncbi:tRNA uridine-5-carboxymethylaminomethyl(34) synthesis GTPase MnmE [Candidatus Albibeggiatoa sp. nov. BB20]|uniref:tRNA uridine-5-carboxymethylaminomethyl(34) synthesis GTPase MnmE n=1 Tax=Candidatus Albibeggiatoa sp. nov. BB20 TaxID=3162723 RepID=UPI0033659C23
MSDEVELTDTIAAIATPIGQGGVGIVRVSGSRVPEIAKMIIGSLPKPRSALFTTFKNTENEVIDQGLAIYFVAPHSYTGEDVLELQGHGGVVVIDLLLKAVLALGVRLANPGEFTERAFLNGKIDLAQAEAIADLIESSSVQAARCALRSLQGEFSQQIHQLVERLIWLRTYIEAGIDFVEEEIDLLADGKVQGKIEQLQIDIDAILNKAQQGFLLKEGMHIALVGEPNVGKSSLLNCLAGRETAIVTPIAGTTRDIVRDQIDLDGMPLHIIDTAGLRETTDLVEQEGIKRTKQALQEADLVILLLDDRYPDDHTHENLLTDIPSTPLVIRNKVDISGHQAGLSNNGVLYLSAKTNEGITELRQLLKQKMGLQNNTEGSFLARRRHLDALQQAQTTLDTGLTHLLTYQNELLAEELRLAQQALSEITGEFTADDLLGQIFSSFCIGK